MIRKHWRSAVVPPGFSRSESGRRTYRWCRRADFIEKADGLGIIRLGPERAGARSGSGGRRPTSAGGKTHWQI